MLLKHFRMPTLRSSTILPVASAFITAPVSTSWVPLRHTRYYSTAASETLKDSWGSRPSITTASWPTCHNPTPYDIFSVKPQSPYSKRRYFELVKLYHPDRHHAEEVSIDTSTCLNRYHLVVLANEILSNPKKQKAYDEFGLGWVTNGHSGPVSIHEVYREADRHFHSTMGNGTARNATWEDWEAWHEAQGQPKSYRKQEPIFMSNEAFAILVVILVCLASSTHYAHVEKQALAHVASRQQENKRITTALVLREKAAAEKSREERLLSFIETAGYDLDWENSDKWK